MSTEIQPERPPLRERKKLRAKQAVRQAAFALFTERGYDETTVDEIADAADVSRASFFRYFKSKEDVLASNDEERRAAFLQRLERSDRPILDALKDTVHAHVAGLDEQELAETMAYFSIMLGSRTILGQAYDTRISWLRALERYLAEELPRNTDPAPAELAALLANITLSIMETLVRLVAVDPDRDFTSLLDSAFALVRLELPESPKRQRRTAR
jgi:AcrR family transcriptional regulator